MKITSQAIQPSTRPYRPYQLVDVFTDTVTYGNALAVVLDGAGLSDAAIQRLARWFNLAETIFILPATHADADYAVRIFTTREELPFAGHPTLGACHAWLQAGGRPKTAGRVVQQCQVGLVAIDVAGPQPAFAAPPLRRTGVLDEATLAAACAGLGLTTHDVIAHQWVDNGPGWLALQLADAQAVLAVRPRFDLMGDLKIGIVGAYTASDAAKVGAHFEVRAFIPNDGAPEDPVTGSLNAGIAQWLIRDGIAPTRYTASQGTVLGYKGRVSIRQDEAGQVWVGGHSVTAVTGQLKY